MEITRMDWPRAVPHTGVSEVDPARLGYTAEGTQLHSREGRGFCQGRHGLTMGGSRTVEEYTCGIIKGESLHTGT